MNKETFNIAFKTLNLAKDQLQTAMQNLPKTRQIPTVPERIVIDFSYKTAMLMGMETLLRAEMERRKNKIMEIKELETQLETLKNNVAKLENKIAEIKRNEDRKNKIPDDVKDIPKYCIDDFEKHSNGSIEYYYLSQLGGDVLNNSMFAKSEVEKALLAKHRAFSNAYFAREFSAKTQLIADCLYFKWLYDREHEPDWKANCKKNWLVYYNTDKEMYEHDYYYILDVNAVYFSSEEIAEKCAEWLNYKYFGIYNPKEGENNDSK